MCFKSHAILSSGMEPSSHSLPPVREAIIYPKYSHVYATHPWVSAMASARCATPVFVLKLALVITNSNTKVQDRKGLQLTH